MTAVPIWEDSLRNSNFGPKCRMSCNRKTGLHLSELAISKLLYAEKEEREKARRLTDKITASKGGASSNARHTAFSGFYSKSEAPVALPIVWMRIVDRVVVRAARREWVRFELGKNIRWL
ncbi:hypothetical protein DL98DRAFT_145973 [Cadophora sp. DSE1049]|nr:hypothetical protein DL98DRAFT_145973 [Cadophora sp. DSE1049]